jgi:hypothetical protein
MFSAVTADPLYLRFFRDIYEDLIADHWYASVPLQTDRFLLIFWLVAVWKKHFYVMVSRHFYLYYSLCLFLYFLNWFHGYLQVLHWVISLYWLFGRLLSRIIAMKFTTLINFIPIRGYIRNSTIRNSRLETYDDMYVHMFLIHCFSPFLYILTIYFL